MAWRALFARCATRLIRLFFHLFYNQFAWTYDPVAWIVSLGQWQAWGRAAIPHLAGQRVLELAHGPGHLLIAMANRGLKPVGLDLSPYMGRMAQRRIRRTGSDVPLVRARAQALPFRSGCFDSAVATFPTEFILDPATGCEAARVLAPHGRLVVVVMARLSGRDPISRFIRWLYRVTGQDALTFDYGEPLARRAGFSLRLAWEPARLSEVRLAILEKSPRAATLDGRTEPDRGRSE